MIDQYHIILISARDFDFSYLSIFIAQAMRCGISLLPERGVYDAIMTVRGCTPAIIRPKESRDIEIFLNKILLLKS